MARKYKAKTRKSLKSVQNLIVTFFVVKAIPDKCGKGFNESVKPSINAAIRKKI